MMKWLLLLGVLSSIGIGEPYLRILGILPDSRDTKKARSISIIAYGDSLTNGLTPGTDELFPYAPHLESALQENFPRIKITIHQGGISGWSPERLLEDADHEDGIRSLIHRVQDPPASLVILLAGTNGLKKNEPEQIFSSVMKLHEFVLNEGINQTIAIGIPPLGPVIYDKKLELKINTTNDYIQEFCETSDEVTFIPFPFWFAVDDDRWSSDTLHLSPKGYQVMGEMLAPAVSQVLQHMIDGQ